jgi:hypothetical protein
MAYVPTTAELSSVLETDLDSTSLQKYIDAAEADLVSVYGAHTSGEERFDALHDRKLWPLRQISAVTSVVETTGTADTTLASNDYRIRDAGWSLERLSTGTNPSYTWAEEALLTYTPSADEARRWQTIVDLVRLRVQYSGLASVGDGDHSESAMDYEAERRKILSVLNTKRRMFA